MFLEKNKISTKQPNFKITKNNVIISFRIKSSDEIMCNNSYSTITSTLVKITKINEDKKGRTNKIEKRFKNSIDIKDYDVSP